MRAGGSFYSMPGPGKSTSPDQSMGLPCLFMDGNCMRLKPINYTLPNHTLSRHPKLQYDSFGKFALTIAICLIYRSVCPPTFSRLRTLHSHDFHNCRIRRAKPGNHACLGRPLQLLSRGIEAWSLSLSVPRFPPRWTSGTIITSGLDAQSEPSVTC